MPNKDKRPGHGVDPKPGEPTQRRPDKLRFKAGQWIRQDGKIACGSQTRKPWKKWRRRCTRFHLADNGRCTAHGGATPSGIDHPSTKIETWSRALPARLAAYLQEAHADPAIVSLVDHIALTDARITELVTRLHEGRNETWINDLERQRKKVRRMDPASKRYPAAVANLLEIIEDGTDYERAWHDLHEVMEKRRKLTETELTKRQKLKLFIPVEHVLVAFAMIKRAIRKRVPDDDTRRLITEDLAPLKTLSTTSLAQSARARRN